MSTSTSGGGVLAVLRAAQVTRLLLASTVGRLPLGSAPLALLVFARETGGIGQAGLLVAAYTAGIAVGGPVLARLADRFRQPPVLWGGALLSTAGFALLTLGLPSSGALAAAVLAGLGAPPFEAGLRVLWRDLLPEERVHTAYTLDTAVQELIFVAGPLLTVAATALGGGVAGLWASAAVQLCGTVLFATAPAVRRWRGVHATRHWAGPLRSAGLHVLLIAIVLCGAGVGAVTVSATGYAETISGSSWGGWLLAAQATGALVGGLVYARYPLAAPRRRIPVLLGAFAAGFVPLLLTPPPGIMIGLMAVAGVMLPPVLTATFVTVDDVAPVGTAAEAFAWVATGFSIGSALGSAAAGVLIERSGEAAVGFALAPVAVGLAVVVVLVRRP